MESISDVSEKFGRYVTLDSVEKGRQYKKMICK